mgnify:CR=1 FL=1
MLLNLLVYGFPLFLLLIEWIFRQALNVNSAAFMGPTLAGVGIGFILPLTIPKERHQELHHGTQSALEQRNLVVFSRREWRFIEITWLVVFCFIASWCGSFYLASTLKNEQPWRFILSLGFGILNYVVALVLLYLKSRL